MKVLRLGGEVYKVGKFKQQMLCCLCLSIAGCSLDRRFMRVFLVSDTVCVCVRGFGQGRSKNRLLFIYLFLYSKFHVLHFAFDYG